jgi:hypothetical protein
MVIKPSYFATIDPFTLFLDTVFADVKSNTVLLASFPCADVFSSICPDKCALTFTFIVQKLTFVHLSVSPS